MNQIIMLIKGIDRKILLFVIAGLLLAVNLFRLAANTYSNQVEEVEARKNLLAQYQSTVNKLPNLKKKVARLEQRATSLERYLFRGSSEEAVSSAMQILLQEMVTKAELEPESIRPMMSGTRTVARDYYEIAIKIRLGGTLNQFMDFMVQLYRSDKLFQIESFTIKPYKKTEMKIFLDVKGYYTLKNA